ncbi:hypothetical protein FRB96_002970 [Tulasnella sp. 330]|nr:hypothetical protein FRB96_002970 [Tulasnella sp. 330]KAG8876141.1 hypothetical protein FRB97_004417 [Tulasnella sp. 331]KAG8881716.1 hypothetical protein FRB98_004178 [Tulasnella sp. 332]
MATRRDDQSRVRDLAKQWPEKAYPCFGWHPWTSHQISIFDPVPTKEDHYASLLHSNIPSAADADILDQILPDLPNPLSLSEIISELQQNFTSFPTALLGEVGIDRALRVPFKPYLEPAAGPSKLTPFHVPHEHQLEILERQIDLAIEMKRSVSMHSVKSQQLTMELFKRLKDRHGTAFGTINFDLHSCGFSPEMCREVQKQYPNVFISLSIAINGRSAGYEGVIKACDAERLLVESDMNNITKCTEYTWHMVSVIATVRGWRIEEDASEIIDASLPKEQWGVVRRLYQNWKRFSGPGLGLAASKESRKARKLNEPAVRGGWDSD